MKVKTVKNGSTNSHNILVLAGLYKQTIQELDSIDR